MNPDKALAAGLTREIRRRRATALADDPRSTFWTDRDVARRMTEAGHPMAHPAVIRAREGQRTISAREWLTFAVVLSVAPLSLLAPDSAEPVEIAGTSHPVDDVAAWIGGRRPLSTVEDPGLYYATAGGLLAPQGTHFAGVLRALADHFDTASEEDRQVISEDVARAALDQMRSARHVSRVVQERRKGGEKE